MKSTATTTTSAPTTTTTTTATNHNNPNNAQSATTTITTTTLSPTTSQPSNIPASFAPGPKLSADGRHVFHKSAEREAFDAKWRAAVARGEDPKESLVRNVEATRTSSFVEYWWRKGRGKAPTIAEEREREKRRGEVRVESGRAGLLEEEGDGDAEGTSLAGGSDDFEGLPSRQNRERLAQEEDAETLRKKERRKKWHDRIRWGV